MCHESTITNPWRMGMFREYPADWDDIRRAIYRRDDYTCQHCQTVVGPFHCHHKNSHGSDDPSNLITLCESCHKALHPHMQDKQTAFFRNDWDERTIVFGGQSYSIRGQRLFNEFNILVCVAETQRIAATLSGRSERTPLIENLATPASRSDIPDIPIGQPEIPQSPRSGAESDSPSVDPSVSVGCAVIALIGLAAWLILLISAMLR